MQLLDLPNEILLYVFDFIGLDELRSSDNYWTICTRLYDVAKELFLLPSARLSERQLQRILTRDVTTFEVALGRVSRLSVYLVSRPWGEVSFTPWISNPEDMKVESYALNDYEILRGQIVAGVPDAVQYLRNWRQYRVSWMLGLEHRLLDLARSIRGSNVLKELIFEASSIITRGRSRHQLELSGLRQDYIYDMSMATLIVNLPTSLTMLTLDTCGTEMIAAGVNTLHLCPLIARHIGKIKTVRLRMRRICVEVFNIPIEPRALAKLIVKLSLPLFTDYDGGLRCYDSKGCFSCEHPSAAVFDRDVMVAAGRAIAQQHSFEVLRISFRDRNPGATDLLVYDCVAGRYLRLPFRTSCQEDTGRAWNSWEESEESQIFGGIFPPNEA